MRTTVSRQTENIIPSYTEFIRPRPEYNTFGLPNSGKQQQAGASSMKATKAAEAERPGFVQPRTKTASAGQAAVPSASGGDTEDTAPGSSQQCTVGL